MKLSKTSKVIPSRKYIETSRQPFEDVNENGHYTGLEHLRSDIKVPRKAIYVGGKFDGQKFELKGNPRFIERHGLRYAVTEKIRDGYIICKWIE